MAAFLRPWHQDYERVARASLLKPISSEERPSRIFRAHPASASRARPTATKSKSPRSKRRSSSSKELGVEASPLKAARKSPESPIEPTVMVDLPVSFLTHPARFKSEPTNSGSPNRRCEQ